MPSSKKNGYIWGFQRQDCVQWRDGTIGVLIGGLCRPVCVVELWKLTGEHCIWGKSVCKAWKIRAEDLKDILLKVPRYQYKEEEVRHVLAREVLWRIY